MNSQIEGGQYFKVAFDKINVMRENGLYCDVILTAKDMEIHAHKIVLASCSDFFKTCFDTKEGQRLQLQEIEGKILLALINYLYTNQIDIEINITTVQNLLIGANILQLKSLKEECCKYLENNLNVNTSLNIFSIAQNENYMDLLKKTDDFIDKNFIEIMKTQDFLNLSIDKLTPLISKDTLEVQSEETIYEGVISWIKYDLARTKYLSVLMKHVRLTLIHRDYLTREVINEPLVKNDLECKDLIINALLSKKIPEMNAFKPRKRGKLPQVLLVMGGRNDKASGTFEFYDFKTNCCSQIYTMPSETGPCNLVVVNDKIYVVGRNDIKEYNLVNNRWGNSITLNSMNTCYGAGILNDCIYTAKGKFDISNQKWSSIAALSIRQYWPSVGVLNGLLYAVGDGLSHSKSVEFYDPVLNVWKGCSNLIHARVHAAVGILHNKMYVIGGKGKREYLNSVECYSPESNKFIKSASMNFPRSRSTAVEFNDKLYVIGGRNKNGELDTIEVYCPKINKWELLPTNLNVGRYSHGAVIVEKIFEF